MTPSLDRLVLVAAAVATVGWAAWRLPDAPRVVPAALVAGAVALALLSVPIAVAVAATGRRIPARLRHKRRAVTAVHGLVLAGWVLAHQYDPPFAGLVSLLGSLAALASLLYVLPLSVGGLAADRGGVGFRTVVLAWPASLLVGVLVFLAPAPGGVDPTRYNATFLERPASIVMIGLAAAIAVLGPAVTAAASSRRARR